MDCPLESRHDLADAYVAGTLSDVDMDAYEQHFFTCAVCLAQVQTLQELKDRLQREPVPIATERPPAPAWTSTPWLGLALAAGLVAAFGWWWQGGVSGPASPPAVATGPGSTPDPAAGPAPGAPPRPDGPSAPAVATPGPGPSPGPGPGPSPGPSTAPSRHAVLAQLAMVVPPRYVPLAVRGAAPPAAGTFDAAMAHYVAGRHADAATALRALSAEQPADPGIAFFWGISELMLGHPGAARDGLTRAIAADVQPYADEAHFYLAKAWLAEGEVDRARPELQYAVQHEAGPEGEAKKLLAALAQLPPAPRS